MRVVKAVNVPLTYGGKAAFMIQNILPAVLMGYVRGFTLDDMKTSLETFIPSASQTPGRLNMFNFKEFDILLDYAHNPAEINGTLEIASNMKHGEIWAVFEPHTYTRVLVLFDDFVNSFGYADHVIMADIYNDREETGTKVSSRLVAEKVAEKGSRK